MSNCPFCNLPISNVKKLEKIQSANEKNKQICPECVMPFPDTNEFENMNYDSIDPTFDTLLDVESEVEDEDNNEESFIDSLTGGKKSLFD